MEHITSNNRVLLHMDGDAFFVGVEQAKDPSLCGLPVVTGEERGIATAMSYEAKALGITRGMPVYRIKKEFPQVIVLAGDYKSYEKYSRKMFDIVRRYADDVEEYSIDECFADLTGLEKVLKMTPREVATRIKHEVHEELGLSVSIGLAPTKVLTKVASNWVKPGGLTVIEHGTILDFLKEKPVGKIWGIGPQTARVLENLGVTTALHFITKDIDWVRERLSKPYEVIWRELRGEHVMEINPEQKTVYSSIQKTRTFHPPTSDTAFLLSQFSKNLEDACAKARYYELIPKKVSLFLKTQQFSYTHALITLSQPTSSPETILSQIEERFKEMYRNGVLYRATGVTLQELSAEVPQQMDLFGESDRASKFEEIHRHLDTLESKFGKKMVHLGSTQTALNKKGKGTDSEDMDRHLLFL